MKEECKENGEEGEEEEEEGEEGVKGDNSAAKTPVSLLQVAWIEEQEKGFGSIDLLTGAVCED